MALSAPRTRHWTPTVSVRFLLLGLGMALVSGIAYVVIVGNPFESGTAAPLYQTATVTQGSLKVTVSATGPVTNPASVPLSFKSGGKLTELDVTVGQQVTVGQIVAK